MTIASLRVVLEGKPVTRVVDGRRGGRGTSGVSLEKLRGFGWDGRYVSFCSQVWKPPPTAKPMNVVYQGSVAPAIPLRLPDGPTKAYLTARHYR